MYPKIAAKTLVPLREYAFPAVPGVSMPAIIHTPHSLDFGPKYHVSGVITREPPRVGEAFQPLVPQADADGNDLGGVRMPEVSCAIATFTGWNLRKPTIGLERYLLGNTGSYLPFARTAAERLQAHDPRASIAERYADQTRYLSCIDSRSDSLIAAGLLLPSDKYPISEAAARHWRWRMQQTELFTSMQRD
jgi:hypothetical protein